MQKNILSICSVVDRFYQFDGFAFAYFLFIHLIFNCLSTKFGLIIEIRVFFAYFIKQILNACRWLFLFILQSTKKNLWAFSRKKIFCVLWSGIVLFIVLYFLLSDLFFYAKVIYYYKINNTQHWACPLFSFNCF